MPKYRHLVIFVFAIIILGTGLYFFKQTQVKEMSSATEEVEIVTQAPIENSISYICEKDKSAYDVLASNEQVEAKDSSFGKFVSGINGVSNGDGKYWLYSIDGQEATVGASTYICKGGEEITWELK